MNKKKEIKKIYACEEIQTFQKKKKNNFRTIQLHIICHNYPTWLTISG